MFQASPSTAGEPVFAPDNFTYQPRTGVGEFREKAPANMANPQYQHALDRIAEFASRYHTAVQETAKARADVCNALNALTQEARNIATLVGGGCFEVESTDSSATLRFPDVAITITVDDEAILRVEARDRNGAPQVIAARSRQSAATEPLAKLTRIATTGTDSGTVTSLYFKTGTDTSLTIPFIDFVEDRLHAASEDAANAAGRAQMGAYGSRTTF